MMQKIKEFLIKNYKAMIFVGIMPLVLFYYEALFHISTSHGFFSLGTLCTMLFSFAYGLICYLLITITKKAKAIRIITASVIGVFAVPYLVEYFVYRQFKEFYDLNTITGGAGDALTSYVNETLALIFCFDGISNILLYFTPLALYLIFSKHLVPVMPSSAKKRITAAATSVFCYALSILLVLTNSVLAPLFTSQYNFQSSMQKFGLVTSAGLDVKKLAFGSGDNNFENLTPQTPDNSVSSIPQTEELPEKPIEYGFNKLELNLEGGSGQIAQLNKYVSSISASRKNKYTGLFKGKNLVFITAEAFTAELIDPELTPTLYRLANKGIQFTDYYQPASAGTTGGEYQNIFGMIPTAGGMSFKNTADNYNYIRQAVYC